MEIYKRIKNISRSRLYSLIISNINSTGSDFISLVIVLANGGIPDIADIGIAKGLSYIIDSLTSFRTPEILASSNNLNQTKLPYRILTSQGLISLIIWFIISIFAYLTKHIYSTSFYLSIIYLLRAFLIEFRELLLQSGLKEKTDIKPYHRSKSLEAISKIIVTLCVIYFFSSNILILIAPTLATIITITLYLLKKGNLYPPLNLWHIFDLIKNNKQIRIIFITSSLKSFYQNSAAIISIATSLPPEISGIFYASRQFISPVAIISNSFAQRYITIFAQINSSELKKLLKSTKQIIIIVNLIFLTCLLSLFNLNYFFKIEISIFLIVFLSSLIDQLNWWARPLCLVKRPSLTLYGNTINALTVLPFGLAFISISAKYGLPLMYFYTCIQSFIFYRLMIMRNSRYIN